MPSSVRFCGLALGGLLRGLDLVPLREHLGGGVDALLVREHVRVAVHELVGDAAHHVVDVEPALGVANRRVKHHLHQQIAELLAVAVDVVAGERVEHLVRLLDQERAQRIERLLAVPRAAVGGEQAVHDLDEAGQRGPFGRGRSGRCGRGRGIGRFHIRAIPPLLL